MLRFIARRLALAVPTLFGVLVVAFLLLYVAPGDPVIAMVGERADPQTIARLRAELHLDDPVIVQFGHYLSQVAHGQLGRSYVTDRPISADIAERFPKTLELALAAMLFATVTGLTLGMLSARKPGGWADRIALGASYLGISFPVYWVGLLLILVFAIELRWFPPSGYGGIQFLVLPALALGMRSVAFLARVTRSSMLDALSADFTRTARAKGANEWAVVARHALRNAMIPVITVIGLDFGSYLTGSILTETVFSWPGIGRYVVNAIARRDLPAIQGTVLFLSVVFVLVNLLADIAYAKADPPRGVLTSSPPPPLPMTLDEYQRAAARTINSGLSDHERLLDATAGLAEEAGEVLGLVRKHVLQGKPLVRDRLVEELGDALWCLAIAAESAGSSLGEVAAANITKLRARHPDGYSR